MTARRSWLLAVVATCVVAAPLIAWSFSGGYFWPQWVWLAVGAGAAVWLLARRVDRAEAGRRRWLAVEGAVLAFLAPVEIAIWLLTGRGVFWPAYSLVTLSVLFGAHVWFVARRDTTRERELGLRVQTLTRTRRGAVDAQAAELRRIERDLHDGAQARMVSTALSIGIAQNMLGTDPAGAAKILEDARVAAVGAVGDLRGVMNGIYPAVLSDRGLVGAVRALVYDLVIPVDVQGDPPARLPAATEAAVYFAVAECLANAVKHGQAARARVRFAVVATALIVEIGDDGVGGAALGRGSGLPGIVERLSAFDATLSIESPPGGPTRLTVRVPLGEYDEK